MSPHIYADVRRLVRESYMEKRQASSETQNAWMSLCLPRGYSLASSEIPPSKVIVAPLTNALCSGASQQIFSLGEKGGS